MMSNNKLSNASLYNSDKQLIGKTDGYIVYLRCYQIVCKRSELPDITKDCFQIICAKETQEEIKLFTFEPSFAYDVEYSLVSGSQLEDGFCEKTKEKLAIINILAKFDLKYPLFGSSFNALLTFTLRFPEADTPFAKLVDYRVYNISHIERKESEARPVDEGIWFKEVIKIIESLFHYFIVSYLNP